MLVIENSYSDIKDAKYICKRLISTGKVEDPWITEGRTGRPMVVLYETRDRKEAEKKIMEYLHKGIIAAIWLEDDEL